MRSHNVLKSLDTGQNRFELCHQAFKAIRKLHNPVVNRIQDTANEALQRLAGAERHPVSADPEIADAAAVEPMAEQVSTEPHAEAPSIEPAVDSLIANPEVVAPDEFSAVSSD